MIMNTRMDDLTAQRTERRAVRNISADDDLLLIGVIQRILPTGIAGHNGDGGHRQKLVQCLAHGVTVVRKLIFHHLTAACGLGDVEHTPHLVAAVLPSVPDICIRLSDDAVNIAANDAADSGLAGVLRFPFGVVFPLALRRDSG